jgi:hypothetical protein
MPPKTQVKPRSTSVEQINDGASPAVPLQARAMGDPEDPGLAQVFAALGAIGDFEGQAGEAIRRAFDEAIMGPRRGRFAIKELDPTEKAYIGLRVQLLLQGEFDLAKGTKLDCNIAGHEVDIKFTLGQTWTIPPEALNELCLLVRADEVTSKFSVGLMRMTAGRLTEKGNRDGKRSVSALGRKSILWLTKDASMPPNFFLELGSTVLQRILEKKKGQARIDELFRCVQGRKIPRIAILSLALQDDPMKRARDARKHLRTEQILVLGGRYQREARELGFDLSAREWVSLRVDEKTYARLS